MNQKIKCFNHNNTRLLSNDSITVVSQLKVKKLPRYFGVKETQIFVRASYINLSITVRLFQGTPKKEIRNKYERKEKKKEEDSARPV